MAKVSRLTESKQDDMYLLRDSDTSLIDIWYGFQGKYIQDGLLVNNGWVIKVV